MLTHSSVQYSSNWANERIDEIDATLTFLERTIEQVETKSRAKAEQLLSDLRKKRDAFRDTIKRQADSNEEAWIKVRTNLETEWVAFELDVKTYIDTFSEKIEQGQATFKVRAAVQVKAWQNAADKMESAAVKFGVERRKEIDDAVLRMKADATSAEQRMAKLNHGGTESWSALTIALTETRKAFDGANQAAHKAFAHVK